MAKDPFNWVDDRETEMKEDRKKEYFDIVEGKQQFVLLSPIAPLAQVFDNATKKYRTAKEGDTRPSIKGVCWVMQDGLIKQAKLPYVAVKAIRALSQNPDWEFDFPFPHTLTLEAEGAGSKEVKYSLTASPKKVEIPDSILEELKKKRTPEEIVEFIKEGRPEKRTETSQEERQEAADYADQYPHEINDLDIPF